MKMDKCIETLSEKQIEGFCSDFSKENEYITETAGFVPLDVKLRRFQEAGQLMQFQTSEFTSNDYREAYLSPDLEITPEMDYEEIQEVIIARQQFMQSIKEAKSNGVNVMGGTEDPEKNFEKAADAAQEEAADEVAAE